MESKGIYEQMREEQKKNDPGGSYPQKLDLKQALLDLITYFHSQPYRKPKLHYPVFDYEGIFTDEEFVAFVEGAKNVTDYDIIFEGGSSGMKGFQDRCNRLNIKLD